MNLYAIPSLIALLCNLCLGGYVLIVNPKERANRAFGAMMGIFAVFALAILMLLTTTNEETALFWCKIAGIAIVFLPAVFVHFVLVFPKEVKTIFAKRVYTPLLYIPSLIFLVLMNTDLFIHRVHRYHWGFYSQVGLAFYFYVVYVAWFMGYGFFVLIRSYIGNRGIERRQVGCILTGAVVVTAVSMATDTVPLLLDYFYLPPMTSWSVTIMAALIAYSIVRYKMLIITPVAEEIKLTESVYDLPAGHSYLVKEPKAEKSFEIFTDLVTHGIEGLCITRFHPNIVRKRYGLEKTPILWLSRHERAENTVSPSSLGVLADTIADFVGKSKNCVVLLDGLEYLILNNDFSKILRMFYDIDKAVAERKSRLILPVNPLVLEKDEVALLEEHTKPLPQTRSVQSAYS